MRDGPDPTETLARLRPRAVGAARLSSKAGPSGAALDGLRMSGAMKVLFPREAPGRLTAMLLNTAGGVTGGDRLEVEATASSGSRLTLTTQAAERIYAAEPEEMGRVETRLVLGAGARLDWLPQETIVFDRARLTRRLSIEMDATATLLAVEPIIFGRTARGERVTGLSLTDHVRISRGGRPLYRDALRLAGSSAELLAGPATGRGAAAAATVLYAAPEAETHLAALRDLLPALGGASLARPGLVVVRLLAEDGFFLRKALIPLLTLLNGTDLPRSWML